MSEAEEALKAAQAELAKLKKARKYARQAFTRSHNSLAAEYANQQPRIKELNVAFSLFKEKTKELEIIEQKLFNCYIDCQLDESEVAQELEGADSYRKVYLTSEVEVSDYNEQVRRANQPPPPPAPTGNVIIQQETKRNFTLPKIQFDKYGGELKDWLRFWSQFRKIHEDKLLSKDDKFYYLLQHILTDSKAGELVNSFPPTGEMYDQAISSLKNRFGRDELLVEFYVRELLKLVLTNAVSNAEKAPLSTVYDQLETHIRSLESLGVNTDTCAAMLYPLVESSLPEELLRTWQRQASSINAGNAAGANGGDDSARTLTSKDRLMSLMSFLQAEVDNEQRISLATAGFGLKDENLDKGKKKNKAESPKEVATASGLLNMKEVTTHVCIFCGDNHESQHCKKAKKMTLAERQETAKAKDACYGCLRLKHNKRWCKTNLKCDWCGGKHFLIMCRGFEGNMDKKPPPPVTKESNLANLSLDSEVFLQTLRVKLKNGSEERIVRAIVDTGSHRSYISTEAARLLKYKAVGQQKIVHVLFGGTKTEPQDHNIHQIHLHSLDADYACNFTALEQERICCEIPSVSYGPWIQELQQKKIQLTDVGRNEPISLLLGSDVTGGLLTGNTHNLHCGPTAIETKLGWTLMGKNLSEKVSRTDATLMVMSMFVQEAKVTDLWSLDVLGITDPAQTKTKETHLAEVKERFHQTTSVNEQKRYEVCLPWKESHPPLVDNRAAAERRLVNTTKKLETQNLREKYNQVLRGWLDDGIIEKVPPPEAKAPGYYLPHRHVLKENSTTPIRPVFDASATAKGGPSLNQCLETGPNLIELIPAMFLKFRRHRYGIVSDIRKAFLQISISPKDRDVLRFLWWNEALPDVIETYRHTRVVFGATSSPFQLGAIIELHLLRALERASTEDKRRLIRILLKSFYVDNCVTSIDTMNELMDFINESTEIMAEGNFDLRGWEYNGMTSGDGVTTVLGVPWDKRDDTLMLPQGPLTAPLPEKITKRVILSIAQKLFDPINLVCPVFLRPKLLLQKLWGEAMDWDREVNEDIRREFCEWQRELVVLQQFRVPRWAFAETNDKAAMSLHVFVDASQDAYAAVIFARTETAEGVKVQLVQAKTRVAPLSKTTIPRLELLAATVGVRLMEFTAKALELEDVVRYYWSDSSTVLAWIQREKQWATFVWNRAQEIRRLSDPLQWRHVPGHLNPADLPSRGCTAQQFLESHWWEGPTWLKDVSEHWPASEFIVNESEVNTEVKKSVRKLKERSLLNEPKVSVDQVLLQQERVEKERPESTQNPTVYWYTGKFSKYSNILRMMAWILRFVNNSQLRPAQRTTGELSAKEITVAELRLLRLTQEDSFTGDKDPKIKCLNAFTDATGLIRLSTLISNRDDKVGFRNPIVLDPRHSLVAKLIHHTHESLNHAGVQVVMNNLRERVWVLCSRKTVSSVIRKCTVCKRHMTSHLETAPAALPENRTKDADVFEVSGVDFAGPVYLKEGQKAWICLFTCAVFRAIHLELVTSLSTDAFLEAFRRFIARRGRPSVMYSDNGTNFVGACNLLKSVDWERVKIFSALRKIEWYFNPPTAAWWGGWWERLVRSVKELLRRVLKRACLTYEEMNTTLCDCEAVINSRPLTYIPEDPRQPSPLSPSMFLQEIRESGVPDLDQIDERDLQKRFLYRINIRKDLRHRFRSEYLGQLSRRYYQKGNEHPIREGDIVLIGNDNAKRLDWPLGLVIQVYPGRDGHVRVVKLRTSSGELVRPVQKLYPLEMTQKNEAWEIVKNKAQRLPSNIPSPKQLSDHQHDTENPEDSMDTATIDSPESHTCEIADAAEREIYTRSGRRVKPKQRLTY